MSGTAATENRPLLVALVVSLVGLFATLATLTTAGKLEHSATALTEHAAADLIVLSRAGAELHDLSATLADVLGATDGPRDLARARVEPIRSRMKQALDGYFALPVEPGEDDLWPDLRAASDDFSRLGDAILVHSEHWSASEALAASRELAAATAALAHAILRLMEFNSSHLGRLQAELVRVRTQLLPLAATLALLCALASVAAVLAAIRTVTRALAMDAKAAQLLKSRADELEAFSARIAHDLLSPLMTVSLALSIAGRSAEDPNATVIHRGVASLQRARRLVEGLLEFARAGAAPPPGARADVREVVDDVCAGFGDVAAPAGVALRNEVAACGKVACSPGVLTSLVSNLVQNAIKYIDEGPKKEVTVRAIEEGSAIRVEVEDTGPGIPRDRLERAFEPFVRATRGEQPGLGLGLATVKKLAESHGGTVGTRPTPGGGVTFWFVLPRAEEPSKRGP